MSLEAIKKYYSDTQFEYKLIWNWRLQATPALHFGYYDAKATNHARAIVRANEALAEFGDLQPYSDIVDAGCGLGHASVWLAAQYHAQVTGISIVPKQIASIQQAMRRQPNPHLTFLVADYLHMPTDDASKDVIWAFESVCHAAQKIQFYQEAFRVLKPGGKLMMAEYCRTRRPLTKGDEEQLQNLFTKWAILDLDTVSEHEKHAAAAGFKTFSSRDVTQHVLPSYRNLRSTCNRYAGLSKLLYKTGIISTVRHNNMLSSMQQANAIEQGIFTYHHLVATK